MTLADDIVERAGPQPGRQWRATRQPLLGGGGGTGGGGRVGSRLTAAGGSVRTGWLATGAATGSKPMRPFA